MELAVPEVSFVRVSTVRVQLAEAILFIIRPVASVDAGVAVDFAAKPVDAILTPIALIDGPIRKDLGASSVAHFLGALGEQMRAWIRDDVHGDPLAYVASRVFLVVHVFDDYSFRFFVDGRSTGRLTRQQLALFISPGKDAELIMLRTDRLVATFLVFVGYPSYVIVTNWCDRARCKRNFN